MRITFLIYYIKIHITKGIVTYIGHDLYQTIEGRGNRITMSVILLLDYIFIVLCCQPIATL